jgi:hypothetical protein
MSNAQAEIAKALATFLDALPRVIIKATAIYTTGYVIAHSATTTRYGDESRVERRGANWLLHVATGEQPARTKSVDDGQRH